MTTSPPQNLLLGWTGTRLAGNGVYVIENPSNIQLQVFHDAGFPILARPHFADPELMTQAGATFYTSISQNLALKNFVNSLFQVDTAPEILMGFDKNHAPGGYVLRYPTESQLQPFRDAGVNMATQVLGADAAIMKSVGADWVADMNTVPELVAILLGGSIDTNPMKVWKPDNRSK